MSVSDKIFNALYQGPVIKVAFEPHLRNVKRPAEDLTEGATLFTYLSSVPLEPGTLVVVKRVDVVQLGVVVECGDESLLDLDAPYSHQRIFAVVQRDEQLTMDTNADAALRKAIKLQQKKHIREQTLMAFEQSGIDLEALDRKKLLC